MKYTISILMAFMAIINFSYSQEVLYCGQTEQTQKLFEKYPHLQHGAAIAEQELEEFTQSFDHSKAADQVFIIPIVFHVIHLNGEENISDEQVIDAVNVLNTDFRMMNDDLDDVIDQFQDITADIEIEFRLARLDPDGNCTNGINRIYSSLTNEGGENMKDLIQWPRNHYLNVWVCADAGGAAGYTYIPSSVSSPWNASIDGIVLLHNYTGSIGTSSVYRSRTLTHECGHWLNLRHCWGGTNSPGEESNCDSDDNVNDTPLTKGWSTCALMGESCESLDNIQNYMEYSYCSRMFTEGQRSRMRSAAQSSIAQRNQLWTTSNLENTGIGETILCSADFSSENSVICIGESISFSDESLHDINEWSWDFGDGTTLTGSEPSLHKDPVHFYEEPGMYTVSLTVGNGINELSITKDEYVLVLATGAASQPLEEGFETSFPSDKWFIYNANNDLEWQVTNLASYTGNKSLVMANYNNSFINNIDAFISSSFDMSGATEAYISYKWAYASKTNLTDDQLRIYTSSDCGLTWSLKKIHRAFIDLNTVSATNFTFIPSGNGDWTGGSFTLDNPDQLSDNFRVKFEFTGKGGNNLYMDDINITSNSPVSVHELDNESSAINIYPNPSNKTTTVSINSLKSSDVELVLVNVVGQTIRTIYKGNLSSGNHEIEINVQDLSDGVYFVKARIENKTHTKRLTVVK